MKETMLRQITVSVLLAIQVLGGGAVTLAHARDVLFAPAGVEASHDARCVILHDELRCALCHYAGARVITQQTFTIATPATTVRFTPILQPLVTVAASVRLTAPARAPPTALS